MLQVAGLRAIATARLDDAQVLVAAGRFDWAVYTCGYAVECGLKARIATTLDWAGFPESAGEFGPFKSFKTHDLEVLLKLTGIERQIRASHSADWSEVTQWDPEDRYAVVGTANPQAAQKMVAAAGPLLTVL